MENRKKWIEEMLATHADDPFLHYALALENQKDGDVPTAISILEKLQASHPDYLACYYQLGKMYEAVGQNDKAVDAFLDGRRLAKKSGDIKAVGELSEALMMHDIFD
jgi:tetratricopeptide (TPR) repeat protein